MIILGVDPGTATTGYGVIRKTPAKLEFICHGQIQTESNRPLAERLNEIDRQLARVIKKHQPVRVAVEDIFFFKNLKTAVAVSQARGVILARAAKMKIPVVEFTPLQIKQAVTSYGRADKTQVQKMVKLLLSLKEIPRPDDAADALAAAICCANTMSLAGLSRSRD